MGIMVSENAFSFKLSVLKKNIVTRLVFLLMFYLCFSLFIIHVEYLVNWYDWWSDDRTAIKVTGSLQRIKVLHGRDSGSQYLYIKSYDKVIRLDAKLSNKIIKVVKSIKKLMIFEYYPTALGSKWAFKISNKKSKKIYYEGKFHDDGWQAILSIFICVGYLLIAVPFIFFPFRDFSKPLKITIR